MMPHRSSRLGAVAVLAALALALAFPVACSRRADDGTQPGVAKDLPALSIGDDTSNLILTWIDEHGDTHVELHPGDVPAEGRPLVRVVVSDREEWKRDSFYVTDLGAKQADGRYACRTMSRRAWEEVIEKRRQAYRAKIAPPPAAMPSGPAEAPRLNDDRAPPANAARVTAIIYGAPWCKPCHQAADYLKAKGVGVVMKDVDASPQAQEEMRAKLERAGIRGGAIPIIDLRGEILVGFNPAALDRAVAKALGGTAL